MPKKVIVKKSVKVINQSIGKNYAFYHGDAIEVMKGIPDNSIHYNIFSPPFLSLYTFSNSVRDMSNSKDPTEFYEHYQYLIKEQFRTLMPGRLLSFHCINVPLTKTTHGVIGIKDFRGDLIRMYEAAGFIEHSEVVIWKDPVVAMQRSKAIGLLHKQIVKDSAISRQGIPDYLITMRKPGINEEPIEGKLTEYIGENNNKIGKGKPRKDHITNEVSLDQTFSIDVWQNYASPVWMDINPSNTLQFRSAREHDDERHISPLQLDVIHRAIQLWSNPGDTILDPFAGIGSSGFEALHMGRRAILIELKKSYYTVGVKNVKAIDTGNRIQKFNLITNKD